jgi:hypothetical protein
MKVFLLKIKRILFICSLEPSDSPSAAPSQSPSISLEPSDSPSAAPSDAPSQSPSISLEPSDSPSDAPSQSPSISLEPSDSPSDAPSQSPSISLEPSDSPSAAPSQSPSIWTLLTEKRNDFGCTGSELALTDDTFQTAVDNWIDGSDTNILSWASGENKKTLAKNKALYNDLISIHDNSFSYEIQHTTKNLGTKKKNTSTISP